MPRREAIQLNVEEVKHFVLDFIRQEQPEWAIQDDGCPRCPDHDERRGEIVPVGERAAE